jgi:hypothetical protein
MKMLTQINIIALALVLHAQPIFSMKTESENNIEKLINDMRDYEKDGQQQGAHMRHCKRQIMVEFVEGDNTPQVLGLKPEILQQLNKRRVLEKEMETYRPTRMSNPKVERVFNNAQNKLRILDKSLMEHKGSWLVQ